MKRFNVIPFLATLLSVAYVLVEVWNGFTRPLGGYYYPDETRSNAITFIIMFAGVISLILFGLILALRKKKLFADIIWIGLAPVLLMLSWDTITKNLVENGHLAAGWLTDSAYLQEPGASLHRTIWIIAGILVALPFVYNIYCRFVSQKS